MSTVATAKFNDRRLSIAQKLLNDKAVRIGYHYSECNTSRILCVVVPVKAVERAADDAWPYGIPHEVMAERLLACVHYARLRKCQGWIHASNSSKRYDTFMFHWDTKTLPTREELADLLALGNGSPVESAPVQRSDVHNNSLHSATNRQDPQAGSWHTDPGCTPATSPPVPPPSCQHPEAQPPAPLGHLQPLHPADNLSSSHPSPPTSPEPPRSPTPSASNSCLTSHSRTPQSSLLLPLPTPNNAAAIHPPASLPSICAPCTPAPTPAQPQGHSHSGPHPPPMPQPPSHTKLTQPPMPPSPSHTQLTQPPMPPAPSHRQLAPSPMPPSPSHRQLAPSPMAPSPSHRQLAPSPMPPPPFHIQLTQLPMTPSSHIQLTQQPMPPSPSHTQLALPPTHSAPISLDPLPSTPNSPAPPASPGDPHLADSLPPSDAASPHMPPPPHPTQPSTSTPHPMPSAPTPIPPQHSIPPSPTTAAHPHPAHPAPPAKAAAHFPPGALPAQRPQGSQYPRLLAADRQPVAAEPGEGAQQEGQVRFLVQASEDCPGQWHSREGLEAAFPLHVAAMEQLLSSQHEQLQGPPTGPHHTSKMVAAVTGGLTLLDSSLKQYGNLVGMTDMIRTASLIKELVARRELTLEYVVERLQIWLCQAKAQELHSDTQAMVAGAGSLLFGLLLETPFNDPKFCKRVGNSYRLLLEHHRLKSHTLPTLYCISAACTSQHAADWVRAVIGGGDYMTAVVHTLGPDRYDAHLFTGKLLMSKIRTSHNQLDANLQVGAKASLQALAFWNLDMVVEMAAARLIPRCVLSAGSVDEPLPHHPCYSAMAGCCFAAAMRMSMEGVSASLEMAVRGVATRNYVPRQPQGGAAAAAAAAAPAGGQGASAGTSGGSPVGRRLRSQKGAAKSADRDPAGSATGCKRGHVVASSAASASGSVVEGTVQGARKRGTGGEQQTRDSDTTGSRPAGSAATRKRSRAGTSGITGNSSAADNHCAGGEQQQADNAAEWQDPGVGYAHDLTALEPGSALSQLYQETGLMRKGKRGLKSQTWLFPSAASKARSPHHAFHQQKGSQRDCAYVDVWEALQLLRWCHREAADSHLALLLDDAVGALLAAGVRGGKGVKKVQLPLAVAVPVLILSMMLTSTWYHVEDVALGACNDLRFGAPKFWLVADRAATGAQMRQLVLDRYGGEAGLRQFYHKQLAAHDIALEDALGCGMVPLVQAPGTVVYTAASLAAVHVTVSCGFSLAMACNCFFAASREGVPRGQLLGEHLRGVMEGPDGRLLRDTPESLQGSGSHAAIYEHLMANLVAAMPPVEGEGAGEGQGLRRAKRRRK